MGLGDVFDSALAVVNPTTYLGTGGAIAGLNGLTGGGFSDLFGMGGMFGPEATNPVDVAKSRMIMRMLGREKSLWPQVQKMIGEGRNTAGEAFGYDTKEISKLYPGVMKQITNYEMDPAAEGFLSRIKDERISGMMGDVDNLIGSKVADLGRRGVLSSSTAEGSMGEVGKAFMPAISKANEDYWTSRLTMPGQNAMQRYSLASMYGGAKGDAARSRFNTMYQPLADLWGGTVGASNAPTPDQGDKNAGMKNLLDVAKLGVGLFA